MARLSKKPYTGRNVSRPLCFTVNLLPQTFIIVIIIVKKCIIEFMRCNLRIILAVKC